MSPVLYLDKQDGMWVVLVGTLLSLIKTPFPATALRAEVAEYARRSYPGYTIKEL